MNRRSFLAAVAGGVAALFTRRAMATGGVVRAEPLGIPFDGSGSWVWVGEWSESPVDDGMLADIYGDDSDRLAEELYKACKP